MVEFGEVHLVVCDGQSILAEMQHVQSTTHRVAESAEHGHQNAALPFRNGRMVVVHNVIDGCTGRPSHQRLHNVVAVAQRGFTGTTAPITLAIAVALNIGPTVIAACLKDVEFVPIVLSVFAAVHEAIWPEAKALAVAVPLGEHVAVGVGIVCWDGSVQIEAEDFAIVAVVVLGACPLVAHVPGAHQHRVVG